MIPVCPAPIHHRDTILLGHGSGGKLSAELLREVFLPAFANPVLAKLEDQASLEIGGVRLAIEVEDPRKWNPAGPSRKAHGPEAIKAPMPGKVVRVLVAVGDDVAAGQGLVVLEAMKMQNEMKAPRAGRVASVAVKEHEAVNAGSVLLTIS